jgi:hypothetical protein
VVGSRLESIYEIRHEFFQQDAGNGHGHDATRTVTVGKGAKRDGKKYAWAK